MHLVTDLARGGAETFLQRLVSAPDQPGIRHRVLSLTTDGEVGNDIRSAGVDVACLGLSRISDAPVALVHLVRLLRKEKPNILMTWLYHADLFGALAVNFVPATKLVWNIRCADMQLSEYGRLTRTLPRLLARLSWRPDAVVANSEAGRKAHAAYGYRPRHWYIFPNGFDIQQFRPDRDRRARVRASLQIKAETPVVGLFARFDPMKDHATFLAAADAITDMRPPPLFLLVGRGTDSSEFEVLIGARNELRQRVIRLGERRDMPELMAATDIAVCSSISEGFPNTIGEAMACGVPCVSTDVGDAALLVGDTGRLVEKRDWQGLAQQMKELLALGPENRTALGTAARKRIEDKFSLRAVVTRYAALFDELGHCRQ